MYVDEDRLNMAWDIYERVRPHLSPKKASWVMDCFKMNNNIGIDAVIKTLTQTERGIIMKEQSLTELLERYRTLKTEVDKMEKEIKEKVADMGEKVYGDGIIVTPRAGRKQYLYEEAAKKHCDQKVIEACTVTKETTDWKKACELAGLVNIPFTEGKASVAIKIEKTEVPAFPTA